MRKHSVGDETCRGTWTPTSKLESGKVSSADEHQIGTSDLLATARVITLSSLPDHTVRHARSSMVLSGTNAR